MARLDITRWTQRSSSWGLAPDRSLWDLYLYVSREIRAMQLDATRFGQIGVFFGVVSEW